MAGFEIRVELGHFRKDILRKRRSPLGIVVMLLFPVVFSLIMAVSFGESNVPRAHVLVENSDDGLLGGMLMSALRSEQVAKYSWERTVNETIAFYQELVP